MKKRFLVGTFLLVSVVCFLSAAVLAVKEQRGLSEKLIRLHVIAASDLDAHAREAFAAKIRTAGQTFFAFTEVPPEFELEKCDRFRIKAGTVEE